MPDSSEDLDLDIKNNPAASQQKTIVLIAVVFGVISLLVVGLAVFLLSGSGGEKSETAKPVEKTQLHPPVYLEIKPAFLVNYPTKARMRYLQVDINLLLRAPPGTDEKIKLYIPLIKDRVGSFLQNQQFDEVVTSAGREKIRAQTLEQIKTILQDDPALAQAVEDVLFVSYVVQ